MQDVAMENPWFAKQNELLMADFCDHVGFADCRSWLVLPCNPKKNFQLTMNHMNHHILESKQILGTGLSLPGKSIPLPQKIPLEIALVIPEMLCHCAMPSHNQREGIDICSIGVLFLGGRWPYCCATEIHPSCITSSNLFLGKRVKNSSWNGFVWKWRIVKGDPESFKKWSFLRRKATRKRRNL